MMQKNEYPAISAEKFRFIQRDEVLHDKKLETKSIGYFMDAWLRFRRNRSAVIAFVLICILLIFAVVVPIFSPFTVSFRDKYYDKILPRLPLLRNAGFWDGCSRSTESEAGYLYLNSIGVESGENAIKRVYSTRTDSNNMLYYDLRADSYNQIGYVYLNITEDDYLKMQEYQNQTGIQMIFPLQATHNNAYVIGNNGANFWYQLVDESQGSTGMPKLDENGNYIANYMTSDNPEKAGYKSLRIESDNGGADGNTWFTYAQKNQTGYKVRVNYHRYFVYQNHFEPNFIFGTNVYGQDIFVCLASGARLSFLLAIVVSVINFVIGAVYGAVEGYYGGAVDIVMERISDILNEVPFIVVATLFQLHMAEKVGTLASLLFAFVLTGWVGMAARVRMQFYRFKGQEYILAARTLGAKDGRLIFKHIFPNSLGTIITGSVMSIPGVIFSESMLSYLHIINLETSSLTSIGTMLSNGQGYLSTYPHIILFPALFISILEISFNLFGNGLRDAFNPSLRGADE